MMLAPIVALSELADTSPLAHTFSQRLDAVLRRLPKFTRVRFSNALCNNNVWTLAQLCAKKRADLRRWKDVGKQSITDIEQTLAQFGLALADTPPPIVVGPQARPIDAHVEQLQRWIDERFERLKDDHVAQALLTDVMLILDGRDPVVGALGESVKPQLKPQTTAQRLSNPVWLREQIAALVADCESNIRDDMELADQASGDVSERYRASVQSHRHWKRQLERVLSGKTTAEDLQARIARGGITP